jgi:CIC family chloride channel protein
MNVLRSLRVSQAMSTDFETVRASTPLRTLINLTVTSPHSNFFVVSGTGQLLGVLSVHDLRKIIYESDNLDCILVAYDLMTPIAHRCTPSSTLDTVMNAFAEMSVGIDELPVVGEADDGHIVGVVSKSDVISIYNREISRREIVA